MDGKKKKIIRKKKIIKKHTNKVIFLNTQGFQNKSDKIKKLVSDYKPTVLVIDEHFQSSEETLDQIPDYKLANSYCRESRQRGGVAVYVRSDVEFILRNDLDKDCLKYEFEMASIEIPSLGLVVTGVYKNSCKKKKSFYEQLDKTLGLYDKEPGKMHVMTGDFNIDFSKNKKATKILNNHEYVYQLACSTTDYGSCLDNFITDFTPLKARVLRMTENTKKTEKTEKTEKTDKISDHRPIEIILPCCGSLSEIILCDDSSNEESSEDEKTSSENTSDNDSDDSTRGDNPNKDKSNFSDKDSNCGQTASAASSRTPEEHNDSASKSNTSTSNGNPEKLVNTPSWITPSNIGVSYGPPERVRQVLLVGLFVASNFLVGMPMGKF